MHSKALFGQSIIPYQELPGNYNLLGLNAFLALIIPYQELPGNYNKSARTSAAIIIIPYQELPGNYNDMNGDQIAVLIIPYQELPGNYNISCTRYWAVYIIPYQELPGNYNPAVPQPDGGRIIPYQELPGNYNSRIAPASSPSSQSYHLFVIINHSVPTINRVNHLFFTGRDAAERNALFSVFKSEIRNTASFLTPAENGRRLQGRKIGFFKEES